MPTKLNFWTKIYLLYLWSKPELTWFIRWCWTLLSSVDHSPVLHNHASSSSFFPASLPLQVFICFCYCFWAGVGIWGCKTFHKITLERESKRNLSQPNTSGLVEIAAASGCIAWSSSFTQPANHVCTYFIHFRKEVSKFLSVFCLSFCFIVFLHPFQEHGTEVRYLHARVRVAESEVFVYDVRSRYTSAVELELRVQSEPVPVWSP